MILTLCSCYSAGQDTLFSMDLDQLSSSKVRTEDFLSTTLSVVYICGVEYNQCM